MTGRLKDLIIIRGRNHYPQDIELTVEQSHPSLQPDSGVAFSVEIDGEERLVIVYEVRRQHRNPDIDEIVAAIRHSVAEIHELSVNALVLVKPLSIPKTSSGKIRRHACRAAYLQDSLDVVGSWHSSIEDDALRPEASSATKSQTAVELSVQIPTEMIPASDQDYSWGGSDTHTVESIKSWVTNWLSAELKIAAETIDSSQSFADYGLDSMMAVRLAQHLEIWLQEPVEAVALWNFPTIESLARHLASEPLGIALNSRPDPQGLFARDEKASAQDRPGPRPVTSESISAPAKIALLSEAELFQLLSKEIAVVKQRRPK